MATTGRWPGRMGARHARRAIRAAEGRHPRLELWRGSGGGVPERASVRRQKRRRADTHQGRRPAHRRGEGVSEAGERRKICISVTFASAVVFPHLGTRNILYVPKLGNTTSGVPNVGNTTFGMFPTLGTERISNELRIISIVRPQHGSPSSSRAGIVSERARAWLICHAASECDGLRFTARARSSSSPSPGAISNLCAFCALTLRIR